MRQCAVYHCCGIQMRRELWYRRRKRTNRHWTKVEFVETGERIFCSLPYWVLTCEKIWNFSVGNQGNVNLIREKCFVFLYEWRYLPQCRWPRCASSWGHYFFSNVWILTNASYSTSIPCTIFFISNEGSTEHTKNHELCATENGCSTGGRCNWKAHRSLA